MARKLKDLTGKTFGNYLVLHPIRMNGTGDYSESQWVRKWLCKCLLCGTEKEVWVSNINKNARGCGCVGSHNRKRPYESLYNHFLNRHTSKVDIEITYEQFVEYTKYTHCVYCDKEIHWVEFGVGGGVGRSSAYNLDRKDNSLGYTQVNCVVCCKTCNSIKSDRFTYEQMLQIGALIKSWRT